MRGLIIKDIYCMRQTRKEILFAFFCTLFLIIAFLISSKYGNLAKIISEHPNPEAEFQVTSEQFVKMFRYVIWLVLIIAMAFTANVLDCFVSDAKAIFSKVLFSMPVRIYEITLARYISLGCVALLGLSLSVFAALVLAMLYPTISFLELLSVIFSFLGIMLMYVFCVIPSIYLCGAKYKDFLMTGGVAVLIIGFGIKLYTMYDLLSVKEDQEFIEGITNFLDKINEMITKNGIVLLLFAFVVGIVSYLLSTYIVVKKGGKAIC